MKILHYLVLALMAIVLASCSGFISGMTGQPVAATEVKREGGTPVKVATADLLQAEAGPKETVWGLYDTGAVARTVGEVVRSSGK